MSWDIIENSDYNINYSATEVSEEQQAHRKRPDY